MGLNNPGTPGANLPASEDHVMRRLADLERAYRELVASTAIRAGSLGNDALASPVAPSTISGSTQNFALSTTLTTVWTLTVTVPPLATKATVSVVARVYAANSTAALDYLYAGVKVAGYANAALPLLTPANKGTNINVSPFVILLNGLYAGATFNIEVQVSTAFAAWAANAANTTNLTGSILWFK